jgi:tetratricopeptide (TPR) repeat protein
LQGKYQTAADAFKETLKWRPGDPLVLNNLALNLAQAGNLSEAETLYRQSVDEQRTSSSHDDFLLSQSIGSLGGVLLRENKLDAAEPLLREALTIRRQSLPSDDPRIATSMNNLAVLLQVQGKLDEAETLLTEALGIQQRAAETPRLCSKPSSAQNAVTITCSALLSESQRSIDSSPSQTAFLYSASNSQSTFVSEKSIVGLSSLAQQRPGIASTMCNLAMLYVARGGGLRNAESLARKAIEAEKQTLPLEHPDLATSYEALGTVLAAENEVHDARLAFQEALEIRLLNFGPEHIYLAEIYESISRLELSDNPSAAKEYLNHALGIETKWWGDTDPRTQATQRNLAKIGGSN